MSQRVDMWVNGKLVNTNQKSDLPAFRSRLHTAVDNAKETIVRRHVQAPVPVPISEQNLLVGHGLFTAWNASAANGDGADWIALQIDPEGRHNGFEAGRSKVLAWEARASQAGVETAKTMGALGYIGQAENPPEFQACMKLTGITTPKYLVGKPDGWGNTPDEILAAMLEAKAKGWGLLIEWYWNEDNSLSAGPNGMNYPISACLFGTYKGAQERKYLDEYRKVWPGSYGCYVAETMDARDWQAFS